MEASGLDTRYIYKLAPGSSRRTAQYVAVNDANKNLVMAMADMDIFVHHGAPENWKAAVSGAKPGWVVVDANWGAEGIRSWVQTAKGNGCSVAFEPVSAAKAAQLFCAPGGDDTAAKAAALRIYPDASIDMATPNSHELLTMFTAAKENGYLDGSAWFGVIDAFGLHGARERFVYMTNKEITDAGIPQQSMQLLPYVPTVVVKLGAKGVLLTSILPKDDPLLRDADAQRHILARNLSDHPSVGGVYMRLFPAAEEVPEREVVSVNGVGDTFLGVLIAGLARGGRVDRLVDVAQRGAVMTLKSREAVSPDLGSLEGQLREAVEG